MTQNINESFQNWKPIIDIDESDEPSDINTEIKINMRRSYVDQSYLPKLETSITKGTRSLIEWNCRPIKIRYEINEKLAKLNANKLINRKLMKKWTKNYFKMLRQVSKKNIRKVFLVRSWPITNFFQSVWKKVSYF